MKNTLLSMFLLLSLPAFSQTDTVSKNKFDRVTEAYKKGRLSVQFPPLGNWRTLDNRRFDFNAFPQATMIYVGSTTCTPCKVETPFLVKYAAAHPESNFVYLTDSDSAGIVKQHPEFADGSLPANFFAVCIPHAYLSGYKLNFGYPTKWIVATNGITKWIAIGGNTKDGSKFLKEVESQLKQGE